VRVPIKKVSDLEIGKVYRYISGGFTCGDDQGARTVSKDAEYDVKVIQIAPHIITLKMLVDQSTINRICVHEPCSYNWSISILDFRAGRERLYEEDYVYGA